MSDGNGNGNGQDLAKLAGKWVAGNLLIIVRNFGVVLLALWAFNNAFKDWNHARIDMEQRLSAKLDETRSLFDEHMRESAPVMREYQERKGRQDVLNEQVARDISEINRRFESIERWIESEPRRNWRPNNRSSTETETMPNRYYGSAGKATTK